MVRSGGFCLEQKEKRKEHEGGGFKGSFLFFL